MCVCVYTCVCTYIYVCVYECTYKGDQGGEYVRGTMPIYYAYILYTRPNKPIRPTKSYNPCNIHCLGISREPPNYAFASKRNQPRYTMLG